MGPCIVKVGGMGMKKKGMAYLLIVSFVAVVVVGIFLVQQTFEYQEYQRVEGTKISVMNSFIDNLNSDMERVIEIGSYRAFIALEDYVAARGEFLEDIDDSLEEVLTNGTIDGTQAILMNDSSLQAYFETVNVLMNRRGIDTDYEIKNIETNQESPWDVEIVVKAEIIVSDVEETARWNYTEEFSSVVNIEGLRDPLFSVKTENRVPSTVTRQNQTLVENGDTSNLEEHIEGTYYIESEKAPSFLQRFENDYNANEKGLESIIDLRDLSDQDIAVDVDRIKVDYKYFNELEGDKACDFEGVDEDLYFVITEDRIENYEVESLNYTTNC